MRCSYARPVKRGRQEITSKRAISLAGRLGGLFGYEAHTMAQGLWSGCKGRRLNGCPDAKAGSPAARLRDLIQARTRLREGYGFPFVSGPKTEGGAS
jgi:hypothetical protein